MMSKNSMVILLAACVFAVLLVSGCTQSPATTTPATTAVTTPVPTTVAATAATTVPGAVGLANPASVNCGAVGGKTEIKTNADGGQYGMCTFANGTTCEEWALVRGEGCKAGIAVAANKTAAPVVSPKNVSGTAGMANPASVNCGAIGGKTEIKTSADGGQYGMCTFANGTTCEEWALFRGEGCKAGITVAATTLAAAATNTTAPVK
jgi:putative hemolysin